MAAAPPTSNVMGSSMSSIACSSSPSSVCALNTMDARSPAVGLRPSARVSSVGSLDTAMVVSNPLTFWRTFWSMEAVKTSGRVSSAASSEDARTTRRAAARFAVLVPVRRAHPRGFSARVDTSAREEKTAADIIASDVCAGWRIAGLGFPNAGTRRSAWERGTRRCRFGSWV